MPSLMSQSQYLNIDPAVISQCLLRMYLVAAFDIAIINKESFLCTTCFWENAQSGTSTNASDCFPCYTVSKYQYSTVPC